ncbi:MAG: helix-turn-helix domain-containing protein [Acidiferrobacteraceae bacterium]
MKESRRESKRTHTSPIAACVRSAVERYFQDLNGEPPPALYDMVVSEVEVPLLELAMEQTQGNQCQAAKLLGINRNTLRKKLKRHGLSK